MNRLKGFLAALAAVFDAGDDPAEPFYDPVHLGAVLISTLVAWGALYWLLWTLLVYEGGLFVKIGALWDILARGKTFRDFGYNDSFDPGIFRGWVGNVGALILCALMVAALFSIYQDGRRRAEQKRR